MRGGIIGLGNVAVHGHLPGWLERQDAEIVAVSDTRPTRRAVAAERVPAARWFDSAKALLTDARLDFVDVCAPPSSHAPLIRAALERGVHVLCEKPLVRSANELAAVADLARASGCVLHTVHNWHHAPMVRLASDLVRAGEIGRPTRVVWHTLRTRPAAAGQSGDDNWRLDPAVAGGGVLSDHGWHVSYVIRRWLGGGPPLAVQARLETRRHTAWPVEDTASLTISFPGAVADVFLTWAADERRNWAMIEGEIGRIELRDDTVILAAAGADRRWTLPPLSASSHHPEWFGPAADDFLSEIASGAPTGANLAEAAVCAMVEHLARESSRRGGVTVDVPPWPAAALAVHPRAT